MLTALNELIVLLARVSRRAGEARDTPSHAVQSGSRLAIGLMFLSRGGDPMAASSLGAALHGCPRGQLRRSWWHWC